MAEAAKTKAQEVVFDRLEAVIAGHERDARYAGFPAVDLLDVRKQKQIRKRMRGEV